jgi:NADH-quinone oxidoreductase subunit L
VTDDQHDDDAHGHDDQAHDDHALDEEALGPVDVTAWGAGIAGVLLGLAVAVAFALATLPVTPSG